MKLNINSEKLSALDKIKCYFYFIFFELKFFFFYITRLDLCFAQSTTVEPGVFLGVFKYMYENNIEYLEIIFKNSIILFKNIKNDDLDLWEILKKKLYHKNPEVFFIWLKINFFFSNKKNCVLINKSIFNFIVEKNKNKFIIKLKR